MFVVGRGNEPGADIPRPADRVAAGFADDYLLVTLNAVADAPDPAVSGRAERVSVWLRSVAGASVPGSYESLSVGERQGARFPVVVFSYWEDKSFSGAWNRPYYGRACRIYTVGEHDVTSTSLDCPPNVGDHPTSATLSNEGWFAN
ncbi:hypothetical protein P0L94_15990 [Microbacter sp. GSS18]|nr:hypothetical protein P0L94_15990 [Microbacter sp. GSS18]